MSIFSNLPIIGQVEAIGREICGDYEGAREAARKAINGTSYVPVLGHIQAAALAANGDTEEAKTHFCRATGATAGIAVTALAAPVAAGGAAYAAAGLGVAGSTGGVGSAALACGTASAAGAVGGKACQAAYEEATDMRWKRREACNMTGTDWAYCAGAGFAAGGLAGAGGKVFENYSSGRYSGPYPDSDAGHLDSYSYSPNEDDILAGKSSSSNGIRMESVRKANGKWVNTDGSSKSLADGGVKDIYGMNDLSGKWKEATGGDVKGQNCSACGGNADRVLHVTHMKTGKVGFTPGCAPCNTWNNTKSPLYSGGKGTTLNGPICMAVDR